MADDDVCTDPSCFSDMEHYYSWSRCNGDPDWYNRYPPTPAEEPSPDDPQWERTSTGVWPRSNAPKVGVQHDYNWRLDRGQY